jgi:hypothetical protein
MWLIAEKLEEALAEIEDEDIGENGEYQTVYDAILQLYEIAEELQAENKIFLDTEDLT